MADTTPPIPPSGTTPGPIKFPVTNPGGAPRPLVLTRRRRGMSKSPYEVSESTAAARESIKAVVAATRSPFGGGTVLDRNQASELERSLRHLEMSLAERERAVVETEIKLAEHERDLAEMEALLIAREQLLIAARSASPKKVALSKEEQTALERLREELERQEASLKEARAAIREREQFLEESETRLFQKVQLQQEKETELEQREEDLRTRSKEFREKVAAIDPAAAAAFKDEPAKKVDEFNE